MNGVRAFFKANFPLSFAAFSAHLRVAVWKMMGQRVCLCVVLNVLNFRVRINERAWCCDWLASFNHMAYIEYVLLGTLYIKSLTCFTHKIFFKPHMCIRITHTHTLLVYQTHYHHHYPCIIGRTGRSHNTISASQAWFRKIYIELTQILICGCFAQHANWSVVQMGTKVEIKIKY